MRRTPRGTTSGRTMSGEKIRILVIDDDVELTRTVCDALESQGYEAVAANSGEQGLELAYTQHPHLVLLDVMMPGMDGYQVCRELQFGYCLLHISEPTRLGMISYAVF